MGESTNDLSWDGQTHDLRGRQPPRRDRAVPGRPAPLRRRRRPRPPAPGPAAPGHLRRQPANDTPPTCRVVHFELDPPARRHRPAPHARPLPVRAGRPRAPRPGLLRGVQHPGVRPRAAHRARSAAPSPSSASAAASTRRTRCWSSPAPWTAWAGRAATSWPTRCPGSRPRDHTKSNAIALAESIGASIETIDIRPAATEMLKGIGHPFADGEPVHDITFENVQAGLRTDFLFRLANQNGGLVIGTSDLSELALGWATYGVGDQMSHYAVNTGVPKTLIQHVIRWVIVAPRGRRSTRGACCRPCSTPRSAPSSCPPAQDGKIQSTEDRIGPYALHDFALFHVLRYGLRPSKIAFLAAHAWADADAGAWPPGFPEEDRYAYDLPTVTKWLQGVPAALLRLRAVQALRDPERAQGLTRRIAVAARRLARAVGRQRRGLARRARGRTPGPRRGVGGPRPRRCGAGSAPLGRGLVRGLGLGRGLVRGGVWSGSGSGSGVWSGSGSAPWGGVCALGSAPWGGVWSGSGRGLSLGARHIPPQRTGHAPNPGWPG